MVAAGGCSCSGGDLVVEYVFSDISASTCGSVFVLAGSK